MRNYWNSVLAIWGIVFLAGCTLAELGNIANDAAADIPAAAQDIVENPSPSNIGLVAIAFLAGLVAKTAGRGFGKAASGTSAWVAKAATWLLNLVKPSK